MKKILIVDDESSIKFLFSRMFKKEVKSELYELFFAEHGEEALDVLANNKGIDLVISDINMPVMDGFELLKNVVNKYPEIPVFMSSAYTDQERQDMAIELGAKKYISKPVDFPSLKEYLANFF
jgi:CheY-like chemotaxis protein